LIPWLLVLWRVPGLPIRDCVGSCNSSVHKSTTVSEIDVTVKTFFKPLCLVLGLSPFEPRVKCPCTPTPPPYAQQLFLNFCEISFPERPLNFFVITIHQVIWPSPGTLHTVITPERHVLKRRHSPRFSKGLLRTRILCVISNSRIWSLVP